MFRAMLILALLGGCAAAGPKASNPSPAWRSLAFEANSWGKPLSVWSIEASGRGIHTEPRELAPGNSPDYGLLTAGSVRNYDLITRSFEASPADYRRVEALLAPARAHAGTGLPCEEKVTDQVYGKVRWIGPAGAQELSYDVGCASNVGPPIYDSFSRADKLIQTFGRAGTVIRIRQIRDGRPR